MTSVVYHTSLASAVNCIPANPAVCSLVPTMKVDNTAVSSWYLTQQAAMQLWAPQWARQPCSYGLHSVPDSHTVKASAVCQTAMQLWTLQCANYHRSLAPTVNSILLSAQNSASSVLTTKVDHKIVSTAQQTPTYLQQQNGWTVFCAYCEICV